MLDKQAQKQVDEIMYEANEKIHAIVNEMRQIHFSNLSDAEKKKKCDYLREEFEQVMVSETQRIKQLMNIKQ